MPTRELEEDMMGWFSAVIERHPRRTLVGAIAVAVAIAMATALLVGIQVAQADHPEVSLEGSNFEIDTDANLKVDDADPSTDWAGVGPGENAEEGEVRKSDKPSGAGDDSFGQGSKEDTINPTVVDGSIPPNKSDLLNFGIYLETNDDGKFLNLFWHRVQEPSGTTNMDFEFNKNKCEIDPETNEPTLDSKCDENGVTPLRTAGDLLIQYDLAQGGTNPQLFLSRWVATGNKSLCEAANSTPCWGDRTNLTSAGDATGSINTSPIPAAESDGLEDVSTRTFGEAQIDFDALSSGASGCVSFGSAYLKSRSSDSFTAAMKDFIAPASTGLSNCAKVIIRKQTNPDEDPNTTEFTYTHDLKTDPALVGTTFKLKDDGVFENSDVLQNTAADPTYVVDETGIPAGSGYNLTDIKCDVAANPSVGVTPTIDVAAGTVTFAIDSADDVLDCTYTNTLRKSTLSTAQSIFPNDTATITGVNMAFDGTVDFQLFGPDTTPNDPTDNCTGAADYTQSDVALDANGQASTKNGIPGDTQADYAIEDGAKEGTYWWRVNYDGNTDPDVTSCVEASNVSINNGGPVNSS